MQLLPWHVLYQLGIPVADKSYIFTSFSECNSACLSAEYISDLVSNQDHRYTVQERYRPNSKHSHHVACAFCMGEEFTSAVTPSDGEQETYSGGGGGGRLILHSCLVKSADRKENTAATSYACVAAYVL